MIRSDRLGKCRHALLYIQEAAVDRALFRSVADLEIFRPRNSASPITSQWGVVADGAGHRGSTGYYATRPAPELDAGAYASRGHAQVAGRDPGLSQCRTAASEIVDRFAGPRGPIVGNTYATQRSC